MILYFRSHGSRIEHLTDGSLSGDARVTLCGKPAIAGARYRDSDRGVDSKLRPLCPKCREAL